MSGFFGNIEATLSIAVTSGDTSVPDPQNADLDEAAFALLTWEDIPNMVNGPETGASTNFNEVEIWGEGLTSSYKGGSSGSESEIVLATTSAASSDGRTALVAAGADASNAFAFKFEWPNGRIEYGRLLVGQGVYSKGAKEDPPQETFSTKVVQLPVIP